MGFKLYGFGTEAARVAHDVSVAATHFLLNQLPELYTASERNKSNFPVRCIRRGRLVRGLGGGFGVPAHAGAYWGSCRMRRATRGYFITVASGVAAWFPDGT